MFSSMITAGGLLVNVVTGSWCFSCGSLDIVAKSTVAENLGKNGKSNRRKVLIRASAGEIRNNCCGSAHFLAEAVFKLTMVSKEEKTPIFLQFH